MHDKENLRIDFTWWIKNVQPSLTINDESTEMVVFFVANPMNFGKVTVNSSSM